MKEKWLLTFWAWKMRGWLGVVDDTYLGKYSVWDAIGNSNGQKIWPRIICCLSPLVQLYYEILFLCNFTYVIHPPGITLLYHLSFFFFFKLNVLFVLQEPIQIPYPSKYNPSTAQWHAVPFLLDHFIFQIGIFGIT